MKRLALFLSFLLTLNFIFAPTASAIDDIGEGIDTDTLITELFQSLNTEEPVDSYHFSCSGDTNDFYFEDFTADYYLSKDTDGVSHLRVVEKFVAVFPECDQNHGITREINYINQAGKNITLEKLNTSNLKATRNGLPENIAKIEKDSGVYLVYLGNASEYVHGRQEYTLEYEFSKVITDFNSFQELYWDTNGTGWRQTFGSVTANLHLSEDLQSDWLKDEVWCYVGSYGESGQDRCVYSKTDDGYIFTASYLERGENLTFVTQFKPDTFTVPAPPRNWILPILAIIEAIIIFLVVDRFYRKTWASTSEKRRWYKYAPVAPQYAPLKGYTVGEISMLYMGKSKNPKVATLLELAVSHKIELRKEDKTFGKTWYVKILNLDDTTTEQKDVLKLIAGSNTIEADKEYKVKKHKYSSSLALIEKSYTGDIRKELKTRGDITRDTTETTSLGESLVLIAILLAVFIPNMGMLLFASIFLSGELLLGYYDYNPELAVGYPWLIGLMVLAMAVTVTTLIVLSNHCSRFKARTKKGLEVAVYVAGLEYYIGLAESARIEFLQSVNGADTSPEGIVKLHEKLLPYAVIFGMEKSWMKELSKYYETMPGTSPDWYIGAAYLSTRDFSSAMSSISSSSSIVSPSSSGGSSSGFSGGGGGGFSGGGGGGGGGGGW